jgi:two-component system response regulator ChvI
MAAVSLRQKLVFVVDDETNIADTLGLILRAEGFAVRVFYDGSSAFDHAQEETPDLILSDVVMPNMDGFVLASKLHAQFPNCRVLLISGNAYTSEWRNNGVADVEILAKPVHPQILIGKVKALTAESMNRADSRGDLSASLKKKSDKEN